MAFIKRRAVSGNNSRSGTHSSTSSMVVVNGRTPFDKRNGSGSFDVPDDDGSWPREGGKVPRKGRTRGAFPSRSRSFWFRVFCLTGVCMLPERFDTSHQFLRLFLLLNFVHFFGVIASWISYARRPLKGGCRAPVGRSPNVQYIYLNVRQPV